jgi:hypothetical protein
MPMSPRRSILLLFICILLVSCTPIRPAGQITVISHPDGPLYVGDQVSFEIITPASSDGNTGSLDVTFDGKKLGSAGFAPYGIGGRSQATLWWVWDTRGLDPGPHTLTFTRLPANIPWNETFTLRPADQVPPPEPGAHWITTTTVCCTLYYISGTAAERDIATLSQVADQQSAAVSAQIGSTLSRRIDLFFMSRVIGHGGFTGSGIYVSYLDGNYIGNDMAILFHHEFVHYYDSELGGSYRPSILVEGLAVYLTGGHFKPEPLRPRAAALFDLDWYIPLTAVANDFYNQQHDIGYLEAGSLVQYLVETFGWNAFNEFYRHIPAPDNQKDADVLDLALHQHFGISLAGLETSYMAYLRSQPVSEGVRSDLKLTVTFFDDVRRYQQAFDPSAYFLTAWLPDGPTMREKGIVADLLRHPQDWQNRLIESLLIRSQKELFSGDYPGAANTLTWTGRVLDTLAPLK